MVALVWGRSVGHNWHRPSLPLGRFFGGFGASRSSPNAQPIAGFAGGRLLVYVSATQADLYYWPDCGGMQGLSQYDRSGHIINSARHTLSVILIWPSNHPNPPIIGGNRYSRPLAGGLFNNLKEKVTKKKGGHSQRPTLSLLSYIMLFKISCQ